MMFVYYIIKNKKALGTLKDSDFLVKTIVTTEVIAEMAKKEGVETKSIPVADFASVSNIDDPANWFSLWF